MERISTPDCKFKIDKVSDKRVTVLSNRLVSGKRTRSYVLLPAYPTTHEDDVPGNPNVVLDPIEFVDAESCEEREVFAPILGHEILEYFHRLHPHLEMRMARCC